MHKLVCGPDKANLFMMPQLSAIELKQLRDMADVPAIDPTCLSPQTRLIVQIRYGKPDPTLSQVLEGEGVVRLTASFEPGHRGRADALSYLFRDSSGRMCL